MPDLIQMERVKFNSWFQIEFKKIEAKLDQTVLNSRAGEGPRDKTNVLKQKEPDLIQMERVKFNSWFHGKVR